MPAKTKDFDPDALLKDVHEAIAPHNLSHLMVNSIEESKPLNDALEKVVVSTIQRNVNAQTAINDVVENNEAVKKSKAAWKKPSFWLPLLITSLLSVASIIVAILK